MLFSGNSVFVVLNCLTSEVPHVFRWLRGAEKTTRFLWSACVINIRSVLQPRGSLLRSSHVTSSLIPTCYSLSAAEEVHSAFHIERENIWSILTLFHNPGMKQSLMIHRFTSSHCCSSLLGTAFFFPILARVWFLMLKYLNIYGKFNILRFTGY